MPRDEAAPKAVNELERQFRKFKIQQVKVAGSDVDGVLRGKYISLEKFFSAAQTGFGFCDVIFGWDSSDALYDNVRLTGWHTGYPDALARIDLSSFRLLPWEPGTALFLVDFYRADGTPLAVAPRNVLRRAVEKARAMGYLPRASVEFEYFFFREDPLSANKKNFRDLAPLSPGMFGYSLLRSSANSELAHAILESAKTMGIEIEGFHTETGPGVYETALHYADALRAADDASLFKTAVKVVAASRGLLATFMAKWNSKLPGSSGHVHQSLADRQGRKNLFFHPAARGEKMSELMRRFMAGQMALMRDFMAMFCPTINSYKRTVPGTWAPTNVTWGVDNRTTALRAILTGPQSTRVEHRLPGADANPYLSIAASLASGLYGIERGLDLGAPTTNAYEAEAPALPRTLEEASDLFRSSEAAGKCFGEEFVEHFAATRQWEERQFRHAVTDWELARYFEII